MIEITEYVSQTQVNPFRKWFDALDSQTATIIAIGLARLGEGNVSRVEPIGEGASELKINRGPGFRIYFGWDGKTLVVLLGGGTKHQQQSDIASALRCWRDYKARRGKTGIPPRKAYSSEG